MYWRGVESLRALRRRAWEVFGDARYERLAGLSNGHLHNLRQTRAYVRRMGRKTTTRAAPSGASRVLKAGRVICAWTRRIKAIWIKSKESIASMRSMK